MSEPERWIEIPGWEGFQHRDAARVVVPTWIKLYTELMSKEEFLGLSFHLRGVLVSLWLEYATSKRQLSDSTVRLSRRLGMRVTRRDLESLNRAGFVTFSASRPASTYTSTLASLEKRREEKNSLRTNHTPASSTPGTEHAKAEREERKQNGYVENLHLYTGVRITRGEVGISYVYDPLGTEPVPKGWPHPRPTRQAVHDALAELEEESAAF